MKNRALCLLLALVFVLGAFPLAITANEGAAAEDTPVDYSTLYVQEGLSFLFSAADIREGDTLGDSIPAAVGGALTVKKSGGTIDNNTYYPWNDETQTTLGAVAGDGYVFLNVATMLTAGKDVVSVDADHTMQVVFSYVDDGFEDYAFTTDNQGWLDAFAAAAAKNSNIQYASDGTTPQAHTYFSAYRRDAFYAGKYRIALVPAVTSAGVSVPVQSYLYRWYGWLPGYPKVRETYPGVSATENDFMIPNGTITDMTFVNSVRPAEGGSATIPSTELTANGTFDINIYRNAALAVSYTDLYYADSSHENYHSFSVGNKTAMNLYAIRIYDRALDADEIMQNHFADIAAHFELDVSAYLACEDEARIASVLNKFKTLTPNNTTKESAQALLDATVIEAPMSNYDRLYVSEGLVSHLSFFELKETDDYSAVAAVEDKQGRQIVLKSNPTGYANKAFPWNTDYTVDGVTYEYAYQAESKLTAGNGYLNLTNQASLYWGAGFLENHADYTFEVVGAYVNDGIADYPFSQEKFDELKTEGFYKGDKTSFGLFLGENRRDAFILGRLKLDIQATTDTAAPSMLGGLLTRWLAYRDGGSIGETYPNGPADAVRDEWNQVFTLSTVIDSTKLDASPIEEQPLITGKMDFELYKNAEMVHGAYENHYVDAGNAHIDQLQIGNDTAMNIYAVRVYNRLLTSAEMKQNHFADLAAYYRIDLSVFDTLDEEKTAALYNTLADVQIDDEDVSREYLETLIVQVEAGALVGLPETYFTYLGVSAKTKDHVAYRAMFEVDEEAIASVEESNGSVIYGMIYAPTAGFTDLDDLTVDYNPAKGTYACAAALNSKCVIAYETGKERNYSMYAEIGEEVSTLSYVAQVAENKYEETYAFRVFAIITEADGTEHILYMDAIPEVIQGDYSTKVVYTYFSENGYADNDIVKSVVGG